MILFFGDSHARTFGLIKGVVPIFVGPAAFNNFINEEASKKYEKKISFILENSTSTNVILSYGSGIKHLVKSKKFYEIKDKEGLDKIAENLARIFISFTEKVSVMNKNIQIKILGPIPTSSNYLRDDENYLCKQVNSILQNDPRYINFPQKYVDSSFNFKDSSFYDFIHVTRDFVYDLLLESFSNIRYANIHERWSNVISLKNPEGSEVKLWGGVSDDDLRLKSDEVLDFRILNSKTKMLNQFVKKIDAQNKNILIFNDYDLYFSMQLYEKKPKSISLHNLNGDYEKAHFIKGIENLDIRIIDKLEKKLLSKYDTVIMLNMERVNQDKKKEIYELTNKNLSIFFYIADHMQQFSFFDSDQSRKLDEYGNKILYSNSLYMPRGYQSLKNKFNAILSRIYSFLYID